MSTLVEFGTEPRWVTPMDEPSEGHVEWQCKMTVDLQWVAAAQPVGCDTQIMMAGSGQWTMIDSTYSAFMAQWVAARGAP